MRFAMFSAGIIAGNFAFAYFHGQGYDPAIERSCFQALALALVYFAGARFPAKAKRP